MDVELEEIWQETKMEMIRKLESSKEEENIQQEIVEEDKE